MSVFRIKVFTVECGAQQGTFSFLLSYCSLLLTQVLILFLWKRPCECVPC